MRNGRLAVCPAERAQPEPDRPQLLEGESRLGRSANLPELFRGFSLTFFDLYDRLDMCDFRMRFWGHNPLPCPSTGLPSRLRRYRDL